MYLYLNQFRAVRVDRIDEDGREDRSQEKYRGRGKERSRNRSNSKYGGVISIGMSLEEDLKVVMDLESRVLRKRRHEPFKLEVRDEKEAIVLKSVLNKAKVELFQEMQDELERHIIECPECWRSETAPVHEQMYEMYETGNGIEENVFKGETEFTCKTCMKTVRGESVVALLDRITEGNAEIRDYVVEQREKAAPAQFIADLTDEEKQRCEEQDGQYTKLFPAGVDSLGEWYSQFENVAGQA